MDEYYESMCLPGYPGPGWTLVIDNDNNIKTYARFREFTILDGQVWGKRKFKQYPKLKERLKETFREIREILKNDKKR